jgi:hypothetical protein
MKNSYVIIGLMLTVMAISGCKKTIVGNPITIEATSTVPINYLRFYVTCYAGPGGFPLSDPVYFVDNLNGSYTHQVAAGYHPASCFTIGGTIPADTSTTGVTKVDIQAFYTHEGHVAGFYTLELKKPHGAYTIRYQFSPATYIE